SPLASASSTRLARACSGAKRLIAAARRPASTARISGLPHAERAAQRRPGGGIGEERAEVVGGKHDARAATGRRLEAAAQRALDHLGQRAAFAGRTPAQLGVQ